MRRYEREHSCRRCALADGEAAPGRPFELPGARATFAPDRVCDVRHLRIEVALDFERGAVEGTCTLELCAIGDLGGAAGVSSLTLDAVEMTLHGVTERGAPLPYRYDGQKLVIDLGERKEGVPFTLEVAYAATPRRGLYFIRPDAAYPRRPLQAWSQGQDEDNRYWFPCFDHPHQKSTSEVVAHVPERMFALSNGALVAERHDRALGRRTFHYRQEVPHSSYLVTLAAGEYQAIEDKFEDVEVRYYVRADQAADARRSFGRTPEMMALFSRLTGERYPYPRYSQITVAEFIFGGMENTSATTLTDQTLHDERAHLDFSSEPLVAHELAHQWFGDLLTCRDWSHGWLNEGFATYLELVWKEHAHGRDEADYDRLADQEAYFEEDQKRYRRPIVTNVFHEPIDVFDRHLYEKGACVLHMLRTELGDERFWKSVRHYVKRHAGGSVESRDLARAVDEATGWNADRFFQQWVFQAGYPELEVEYAWDEAARQARLTVKQKQKVDREVPLFVFPVVLRLVTGGQSEDVPLWIRGAEETFVLPRARPPEQAIFDPGAQMLKAVEAKKPRALWEAELADAQLSLDRVAAARALGKAGDPSATDGLARALAGDSFWAVRGEAGLALGELKTQRARDLLAAALGKEAHPKARRLLVRALGAFRHDETAAAAAAAVLQGDASYFVEAEAASALARTRSPRAYALLVEASARPTYLDAVASACLSGLAELRDERGFELLLAATRYGRPVVARRAAIVALAGLGAEQPAARRRARETLCELLLDPDFRARIAAVDALRVLGDADGAVLAALQRAEGRDLDGRVRRRAREVGRALALGQVADAQVRALRDAVEKLEGESRGLKERLIKLEAGRGEGEGGGHG
jgi:aminopeptidase N